MPFFPEKNLLLIQIPSNGGKKIIEHLGEKEDWFLNEYSKTNLPKKRKRLSPFQKPSIPANNSVYDFFKRKMIYGCYGGEFAFQYTTLTEIISMQLIPDEVIQESRIIAIHRHPLERIKSIFKDFALPCKMNFEEFCINIVDKPWMGKLNHTQLTYLRPQLDFITVNGEIPESVELIPITTLSGWLQKNYDINLVEELDILDYDPNIIITDKCKKIINQKYKKDYKAFKYI
jgi:hypothetical protein